MHKMQGCLDLPLYHYARSFTLDNDTCEATENFTVLYRCRYNSLTLLLNEPIYNDHPCTKDLLGNSSNLFATFLKHPKSSDKAWAWASNLIKRKYSQDIQDLADIESGWHFGALKASEKKLTDFRIEDKAEKMQKLAPALWDLLGLMLTANSREAWLLLYLSRHDRASGSPQQREFTIDMGKTQMPRRFSDIFLHRVVPPRFQQSQEA
jgi:hypothetical protein